MKKIIVLSLVFALTAMYSFNTKASVYVANDNLIDALFIAAPEVSNVSLANLSLTGYSTATFSSSDKNAIVAIVLDFFLGGFGVHRFYLGTEVLTGIGYILTCGGIFGIVPLVDFVVLIIDNKDISKYCNNPRFFMWI
jgi:TM2 domain-containing membrane protein YozV